MKKTKILSLFALVALVFTLNFDTALAAPNSIKVKRAEVLSDTISNNKYGFTYFTTTEGDSLYCIDNQKLALQSNTEATLVGEADAGVQYILEHGYPNVRPTGNDENDKIITQAAIWWYLDDTNQGDNDVVDTFRNATTTDLYDLIPKYIKPLVANAKKAVATKPNYNLNINSEGNELVLSDDGNYYESRLISVDLTGIKSYNATFDGGTSNTRIVDETGKARTIFNNGEKFKVRIPTDELNAETTVNIEVSAKGVNKKAQIYKSSNNDYQRVVGLYSDETPLTKAINLTVAPDTTTVEVDVPNTSANVLMISVVAGIVIIIVGLGVILYRTKRSKKA